MNQPTCDKCGPAVVATTRFRFSGGLELTFCEHHAREYSPIILASIANRPPVKG